MSDGNISFIIAIASSIGLISSEILPFIPIKGNGILHSIFFYLSKLNGEKKDNHDDDVTKKINIEDDKEFLDKLDKIEKKIDKNDRSHSLLIKQIKEKVDSIHLKLIT